MQGRNTGRTGFFVTAVVATAFSLATPAWAKNDEGGKHKDKAEKHERKEERKADKEERKADKQHEKYHQKAEKRQDRNDGPRVGRHFDDRHRDSVRRYYTTYDGRACPPGLAKKNNGCMPPGQVKHWNAGDRLPPSVTIYQVPQPILVSLPPPPPQHRYVRVSGDILLISITTRIVVDAITASY